MASEKTNGEQEMPKKKKNRNEEVKLHDLLNDVVSPILFPEPTNSAPLLHRIKTSLSRNAPLIPQASRNTARDTLLWTRAGSPLRPLLLISVGTITILALTGLLVFTLFFLFATINVVIVSLLISLAAAAGCLALFFACVTAIYIAALLVAIFAISTVIFWTIVAIAITTAWIGFFYMVWLVTRKSLGFAKQSLSVTSSAISTYSAAWGTRNLKHD
ncbi:uncharacterized protein LOC130941521 [Arachis stenosperma]|uniref:uncharacterized protein LOC130941521 n=1 Tax=Arachis stenosperma TaxID=217475 RepID=UPI0025ACD02D|nr:uncharacterized protein LOC130941521 [Arachis stenosperma]